MKRKRLLALYARGIAMGAADIVPGVSGGTIAFITGIYEPLLYALRSINTHAWKLLIRRGPKACWQYMDGSLLLALTLGILTSIALLAHLISWLIEDYPLPVWSFFFGLISASCLHMLKQLKRWKLSTILAITLGLFTAYFIVTMQPATLTPSPLWLFIGGAIALCAMILPGISGSFILVLLGLYQPMLVAVKQWDLITIGYYLAGGMIGLLSFARVLTSLFKHYHDMTIAWLTGLLIGSLHWVWPWKITLRYAINERATLAPFEQRNVLPDTYHLLTGIHPQTSTCILLIILGLLLVLSLEFFSKRSKTFSPSPR